MYLKGFSWVVFWTVHEEIVQVPVNKTITITNEVPDMVFENVSVNLTREDAVEKRHEQHTMVKINS